MKLAIEKILNKIGSQIGLNLPYFIKNGSWVSLRFLIQAISGWLVSLFFARLGSKVILGQYQFILSCLSITSIFSLPGLNAAALESVVKGREAGVIKAVKLSFLFSLLGVPILMVWGIFIIFVNHNLFLGKTLIFASLLFPFFYALNTWTAYYEGKSLFKEYSSRLIIVNICLSFLLILGIILQLHVLGLILIYLLVNILFFGYYFQEVFKKIKIHTDDFIDVKFGLNVSIQKFTYGLSSNIPPLAISFLFGIESVAIYYLAYYVISAAFAFLGSLFYLYLPTLFKGARLNHGHIIIQNVLIGAIIWLAFIVFIKYFFILLYGPAYHQSLVLAYKISFLLFFIPLKTYLINFFMTRKRNWLLIATVCVANSAALLLLYFIKDHGFTTSITIYLYTLELMTTIPLFLLYLRDIIIKKRMESYRVLLPNN